MEDQLESLSAEIRELKEEVTGLKDTMRHLDNTMSGFLGTGSEDLVGAIMNLQGAMETQTKRMGK